MLDYCMNLLPGSYGHSSTGDTLARSFPYYNMDTGKFVNGEQYYTKRDCYEGYLLCVRRIEQINFLHLCKWIPTLIHTTESRSFLQALLAPHSSGHG